MPVRHPDGVAIGNVYDLLAILKGISDAHLVSTYSIPDWSVADLVKRISSSRFGLSLATFPAISGLIATTRSKRHSRRRDPRGIRHR